jgi:hypothetical protein
LQGQSFFAQDSIPSYNYIWRCPSLLTVAAKTGWQRKMGYIDTSVVMKVIDTVKNLYKVQLSALHYAFIEKLILNLFLIQCYQPLM